MSSTKRIAWVDIIKGIGIIIVVISHAYKDPNSSMLKIFYTFSMPLFFFVSGYMFKEENNIKEHAKNKFYQLLIPYFSSLILFLPISIYFFPAHLNLFYYNSIPIDIGRYFFGRSNAYSITGSIWFLPCLFFTQVIFNFLRNKLNDNVLNITIFVFLLLGYVNYLYFKWFFLPLYLHLTLAAIPLFYVGYLYRINNVKDNLFVMAVLTGVSIWGITDVYGNAYNILDTYYGIPFLTFLSGVVLTIVVKNISIVIDKFNLFSTMFINLGRASIVIMAFHLVFVIAFTRILTNPWIVTILALFISFGIYYILNLFSLTRALFVGKKEDTIKIKNKIIAFIKR